MGIIFKALKKSKIGLVEDNKTNGFTKRNKIIIGSKTDSTQKDSTALILNYSAFPEEYTVKSNPTTIWRNRR